MHKGFQRLSIVVAVMAFGAIFLAACTSGTNNGASYTTTPPPATAAVTIPAAQEVFAPFILKIQPRTTVTWQNADTIAHTISTTWDTNKFLNPEPFSLSMTAGQHASFMFTKPGLYDYFDSKQATWDKTDHRVAANKGVPNYPLAMEGIIWVQGPVNGLVPTAKNLIPKGKDDFTTDFLAIAQGGTVMWHNGDTDTHFISPVQGWSQLVNPANFGIIQIPGTDGTPGGGTKAVTFTQPGLYYYYCAAHAAINSTWHRAQAHSDASEAPIPMEGFILVVG